MFGIDDDDDDDATNDENSSLIVPGMYGMVKVIFWRQYRPSAESDVS